MTEQAADECAAHLHLVVQPIVQDEVVRHPNPVWLHGMASPIVIASKLGVIEVGNLPAAGCISDSD